jgi:hypothetical protein
VTICRAQPGPFSLFVRRTLGGGVRDQRPSSRRALEVRLLEASLAGEHESERGLTLVASLTRAALLLGLLGTVTGLEVMFREMAHSGPGDLEFWRTGLSTALVSAEAGLVVALSGLAGRGWLSSRARALADEIRSSGIRPVKWRGSSRGAVLRTTFIAETNVRGRDGSGLPLAAVLFGSSFFPRP